MGSPNFRIQLNAASLKHHTKIRKLFCIAQFPHSTECGLIEAVACEKPFSTNRYFRIQLNAASLKQLDQLAIDQIESNFRIQLNAASLKPFRRNSP